MKKPKRPKMVTVRLSMDLFLHYRSLICPVCNFRSLSYPHFLAIAGIDYITRFEALCAKQGWYFRLRLAPTGSINDLLDCTLASGE